MTLMEPWPCCHWWNWYPGSFLSVSHQVLACKSFMRPLWCVTGAQRAGQQRLSGNRGLSVRLGMQTIFSAAKIKLGERAYQRVALSQCSTPPHFFTPHIRHSMAKWKKVWGGGEYMKQWAVCVGFQWESRKGMSEIWSVRKGAKLSSVYLDTNGFMQD